MTPMHFLNDFQKLAQDATTQLIDTLGKHVVFSIAGERETYLVGDVDDTGLRLWLYEDELEFRTASKHLLLERPDFDDLSAMLGYFLEQLKQELTS
jgi:hypothetical protein